MSEKFQSSAGSLRITLSSIFHQILIQSTATQRRRDDSVIILGFYLGVIIMHFAKVFYFRRTIFPVRMSMSVIITMDSMFSRIIPLTVFCRA